MLVAMQDYVIATKDYKTYS